MINNYGGRALGFAALSVVVGCRGIILPLLGILAVVLRERLIKIGERFSDWSA